MTFIANFDILKTLRRRQSYNILCFYRNKSTSNGDIDQTFKDKSISMFEQY